MWLPTAVSSSGHLLTLQYGHAPVSTDTVTTVIRNYAAEIVALRETSYHDQDLMSTRYELQALCLPLLLRSADLKHRKENHISKRHKAQS